MSAANNTVTIKKGDTDRFFADQLRVDGTPTDLTGATVKFLLKPATGGAAKVNASASIVTAAEGRVKYAPQPADVDTAGVFNQEWEVTIAGKVLTYPTDGYNTVNIVADLA